MPIKERKLEDMKIWELEKEYYRRMLAQMRRGQPKVHIDRLNAVDNITDSQSYLEYDPILKMNANIDPITGEVVPWGMIEETELSTAGDPTYTFPSTPETGLYQIWTIVASGVMDATVADRTWLVAIEDTLPVAAATAARSCETTVVTSSASQHIQMVLPPRPYHFANDHGTLSIVADENPLPLVVKAGASVIFENSAANWGVADSLGLTVRYRRVA